MFAARGPGPWPGLIVILSVVGALGPGAGRAQEGAPLAPPLPLPPPALVVEPERSVDVAGQILWSDPERIHLLGLLPRTLLAIAPGTGIVDVLAIQGGGPFDIQGPMVLLAAGARPTEVLLLDPARLRTTVLGRHGGVASSRHEVPLTGCVNDPEGAWWLGPVPWDPASGEAARVQLRRGPAPGPARIALDPAAVWSARHHGGVDTVLPAQYFTRLLEGPGGRLWRVVLGIRGQADLIDPGTGESRPVLVDPAEGAWIEASVDRTGCLHLLVAGGPGSRGRRILRFAPDRGATLSGDRDWSTGAVDPTGERWAAVDAESGAVLVYRLDPITTGRSNR